jgi:hypothetical protein
VERRISSRENTRKARVEASQGWKIHQHGWLFLPRMVKSITRMWKERTSIDALITTDGTDTGPLSVKGLVSRLLSGWIKATNLVIPTSPR